MPAAPEPVNVPAVRFDGVGKRFPGVVALDGVSFDVAAGSCHAICGENGAGKSTLAKVLAGVHAPDAGAVLVFGEPLRAATPRAAFDAGIAMVHQEPALCDNMSVAENLCLSALPARRGLLDRSRLEERAAAMLEAVGGGIDVRRPAGELTVAQQQLVLIAAAVGGGARIIIFDEPTSSLSQPEAEQLYELIAQLKERGLTCLYVSHRLPEIFLLCDTVTVLRDGRHVLTAPAAEMTENDLVRAMIGRPVVGQSAGTPAPPDAREVLRVQALTLPGRFQDISFTLRAGEVLGLAGLVGAGRSEVAAALFGLERGVRGDVVLDGQPVRIRSPRHAIRLGLGLVPEDRKRQGLVLSLGGRPNLSLPILKRLSRLAWVRRDRERALTGEYFDRLSVRAPGGMDAPVASLSGGNQQKIVLARWLAARCRVLILDEPTRGVDVGAKAEIHALIRQLAATGTAILLISSELPELLSLSTRILVLRNGRVAGELAREKATQDRVLRLMAGLDCDVSVSVATA